MKSFWFRQFNEISMKDVARVGGKAASLGELSQAGLPVPPGFAITIDAYRQFSSVEPSTSFLNELMLRFDELNATRVAVRSSALVEDSPTASWAGQFESVLNVAKPDVADAIATCWRSAEQARTYAALQQASRESLAVGVIVQAMIPSEVAGVAFSRNPVTATDEIVIEAVEGLGESLVQGAVTPDSYVVGKDLRPRTTEGDLLSSSQRAQLATLVMTIEHHYGSPQDIEWAWVDGQFYILQSRPITTLLT